jgi:hypothetical protein
MDSCQTSNEREARDRKYSTSVRLMSPFIKYITYFKLEAILIQRERERERER